MFVYTAKLRPKKILLFAVLAIVVIAAVIVIAGSGNRKDVATLASVVGSNEDRVAYLNELGWSVSPEPVDSQNIVIPETFSGVYEEYNTLQTSQGFDLTEYGGAEAMRYTYEVLNYPGADGKIYADIVVYRNKVIAGDIQSAALNGFMQGLSKATEEK